MANYRVDDLHSFLGKLRIEGCEVDAKTEESEFGKFDWVMDCEGSRVELWEPLQRRFPHRRKLGQATPLVGATSS